MGSTGRKITRVALARMLKEGLTSQEMAQALQVTQRSIDRALVGFEFREKRPAKLLTDEELERARLLATEGMPILWIAEDLARSPMTIAKKIPGREQAISEWREVWQYIRRREHLHALHDQFHPRERASA